MSYEIHEVRMTWDLPKFIEICCFNHRKMVGIYHYEDKHFMHPTKDTVAVFKIKYKSKTEKP